MKILTQRKAVISVMVLLLLAFAVSIFYMDSANAQYNYDHVNVTTKVNVTNAYPEILNTSIQTGPIVLVAGGTKTVSCNASIRDWNGFNDIDVVTARFYYYLNQSNHSDDNNEHYTNTSCNESSNDGQYLANYSCSVEVYYYANNGTWNCNISVNDSSNFQDAENGTTSIASLYALNVTDIIDYGNLSVTDYSDNITATVTNFGNNDVNISLLGYGQTEGDGLGLVCALGTNITVENQRFSTTLVDWTSKTQLSDVNQDANTTLAQQTDDSTPVIQNTYWELYVPPNPFGVCTGVVRFTATTP